MMGVAIHRPWFGEPRPVQQGLNIALWRGGFALVVECGRLRWYFSWAFHDRTSTGRHWVSEISWLPAKNVCSTCGRAHRFACSPTP